MSTFLNSQEIQDLINVDRSTVYRMAEDGRLPAVKVGRQWRFPADRVAAQFGLTDVAGPAPFTVDGAERADEPDGLGLAALLRPDDAQSIADMIGELFGVMAVMTDMDGHPITEVANPCGYYAAIADHPDAVAMCLSQWRLLADEPHVAARWVHAHLGFLCARTFLWVDLKPVGMIIVGGVTPPSWPPPPTFVESIADEIGVEPRVLLDRVDATWDLDLGEQRRVLRLLPQMGDLVSQLVTAHRRLLERTDHVVAAHERGANGAPHFAQPTAPQGGDRS